MCPFFWYFFLLPSCSFLRRHKKKLRCLLLGALLSIPRPHNFLPLLAFLVRGIPENIILVVLLLLLLVLSSERFGAENLVGKELCREPTTTQAGTGTFFVFLPQQQTSRTASAAVHTPTSAASTDSRSELRRDGNPATHQAFYIPRILGPRGVLHRLCRLGGGSGAAARARGCASTARPSRARGRGVATARASSKMMGHSACRRRFESLSANSGVDQAVDGFDGHACSIECFLTCSSRH